MALSWNEIRSRAISFSKEWEGESRENAESQSFWNDFFQVFGVSRRRVATFEKPVEKLGDIYLTHYCDIVYLKVLAPTS